MPNLQDLPYELRAAFYTEYFSSLLAKNPRGEPHKQPLRRVSWQVSEEAIEPLPVFNHMMATTLSLEADIEELVEEPLTRHSTGWLNPDSLASFPDLMLDLEKM